MQLEELLISETEKLKSTDNANESANILYSIIKLNIKLGKKNNLYKYIKLFIDNYVESIKSADYGYDNFNYKKINQLIDLLTPEEQLAILQYMISVTARELPEHDRSWFVKRKHKSEIIHILSNKMIFSFPKVILLYFGQSMQRLLIGLSLLFITTCLILMPAPIESLAVLSVTFEDYSESVFWNHILNAFSLFANLKNGLKINPHNWVGLLLIISGKLFFVTVIINFIYFKISDKISQK